MQAHTQTQRSTQLTLGCAVVEAQAVDLPSRVAWSVDERAAAKSSGRVGRRISRNMQMLTELKCKTIANLPKESDVFRPFDLGDVVVVLICCGRKGHEE